MRSILISAGHGGGDPGACANGHREADLAVRFRDALARRLRSVGVSVLTDGSDGINEPLKKACALARSVPGRAIEFHLNASLNPAATGVECIALPVYRQFAQELAQALAAVTGLRLRGQNGWIDQSQSQHHRLGFVQAGGVIVELAFISNPDDVAVLLGQETAWLAKLALILQARAGVPSTDTAPVIAPSAGDDESETNTTQVFGLGDFDEGTDGPIHEIQARLVALGLLSVRPDGSFGPLTEAAVKLFQRRQNLDADGLVGPNTWGRLLT